MDKITILIDSTRYSNINSHNEDRYIEFVSRGVHIFNE